jgi:hypothetical protein
MMHNFIFTIEPFAVRANSREEAFSIATQALPGATLMGQYVDDSQALIEFASYLKRKQQR